MAVVRLDFGGRDPSRARFGAAIRARVRRDVTAKPIPPVDRPPDRGTARSTERDRASVLGGRGRRQASEGSEGRHEGPYSAAVKEPRPRRRRAPGPTCRQRDEMCTGPDAGGGGGLAEAGTCALLVAGRGGGDRGRARARRFEIGAGRGRGTLDTRPGAPTAASRSSSSSQEMPLCPLSSFIHVQCCPGGAWRDCGLRKSHFRLACRPGFQVNGRSLDGGDRMMRPVYLLRA
jgi:hypothetical protein